MIAAVARRHCGDCSRNVSSFRAASHKLVRRVRSADRCVRVATAPALSPDGRMLAFMKGDGPFLGAAQIWLKLLPDGEAVPVDACLRTDLRAGLYARRHACRLLGDRSAPGRYLGHVDRSHHRG